MLLGWCKAKILIWVDSGSDSILPHWFELKGTVKICSRYRKFEPQRFRKFREKTIWFWSEFNLVKFDCNWSCTCKLSSNIRQETEYEPSEWVGEFQRMIQYASYSVDQLIFGNSASGCDQISLRQVSNVINDMLYLFTFSQWYALYIDLFPMICSSYWPMPNIDCTCIFLHNVISCLRQYITSVTISKCETTFDWIIYLEMVAYSLCIMQCI